MITQIEGVVTIKDKDGKMVAIIYKDGPTPPVVFKVEVAGVEEVAELIGKAVNNIVAAKSNTYPQQEVDGQEKIA